MRWSPNGNSVATASWDGTSKIIDFISGKILFAGGTSDKSNRNKILLYLLNVFDLKEKELIQSVLYRNINL